MAKTESSNPTDHCRSLILEGTMISIDPSSGKSGVAGYAKFDGGYLVSYGVINIKFSTIAYKRFQSLRKKIAEEHGEEFEVLTIELLKGRSRNYNVKPVLKQAAAVTAASLNWKECVMITPNSWQAIAKRIGGWIKQDDVDAVYQGYAAIAFANGYKSTWKKEAQLAFLEELATEYKWKKGDWNGSNSSNKNSY